MFYVSFMVTTKQKPIADSQKLKRIIAYNHCENFTKESSKRERKEQGTMQEPETINNMTLVITQNVNRLNSPIKKHRVAGWMKKQNPTICCLFSTDNTIQSVMKTAFITSFFHISI